MDKVYLARCESYDFDLVESKIFKMFDSFGGAEAILKGGKKVTVKVNLLLPKKPGAL